MLNFQHTYTTHKISDIFILNIDVALILNFILDLYPVHSNTVLARTKVSETYSPFISGSD